MRNLSDGNHFLSNARRALVVGSVAALFLMVACDQKEPVDPKAGLKTALNLSLIHISEPTRPFTLSRMPSSA